MSAAHRAVTQVTPPMQCTRLRASPDRLARPLAVGQSTRDWAAHSSAGPQITRPDLVIGHPLTERGNDRVLGSCIQRRCVDNGRCIGKRGGGAIARRSSVRKPCVQLGLRAGDIDSALGQRLRRIRVRRPERPLVVRHDPATSGYPQANANANHGVKPGTISHLE
jgi:hypothetical protein